MQDAPIPTPVPESPNLPPPMQQQPKKSNKTLIIILVVVLVLCCICLPMFYGVYWLYQNGDQFLDMSYLLNLV
jgi:hypothetical protein